MQFEAGFPLIVQGVLQAEGAPGDSVTFAPWTPESTWNGIQFLEADEGSVLSYCVFTEALREGYPPAGGSGGAIFSVESSPLVTHCRFADCRSIDDGWTPNGGGAIWCQGGAPRIIANHFRDCHAAAACVHGGGAIGFHQTDIVIRHNEILGCSAHGQGGGISGTASTVDIAHNVIAGCEGFHYGGGVALRDGCSGILFDNLIVGNAAPDLAGGGIYLRDCDVDVVSCTVADNAVGIEDLGYGGGLYVEGDLSVDVHHCIFWGNSAPDGAQIHPANLSYVDACDIQGGYPYGDNLALDPAFADDPAGVLPGYFLSSLAAGQAIDSPCIDAGWCDVSQVPELAERTTRTDLVEDTGLVDLGFHHAVSPTTGAGGPPRSTALAQNRPNPFNPITTIGFELPTAGPVTLTVFDVAGHRLATLVDEVLAAGRHTVVWDGRDAGGQAAASGVYFYRLTTGRQQEVRRMILIR